MTVLKFREPALTGGLCRFLAPACPAQQDRDGKCRGSGARPVSGGEMSGLGTLEARAYLLLSLATGGLSAYGNPARADRAMRAWRRFVARHPQFASPLIS